MEIFAPSPRRHLWKRMGNLMNCVSDFFHKDLTFIDFSGKIYTRDHLTLAENYYYEQLESLSVKPQCVYINTNHLFTATAAMTACWAHGIPVYYGAMPNAKKLSKHDRNFYSFIDCVIGTIVDYTGLTDQVIPTKESFVVQPWENVHSVFPESKNINQNAFITQCDDSVYPSGLVYLTHKDILDQCLYTNKSIGFTDSDMPVHPTRTLLQSLISYTLPALVNCKTHYYDTDIAANTTLTNYLYKKFLFCKKIGATHIYLSSVKNLNQALPSEFSTEFVFVTCADLDIPTAQSLITDHGATSITCFYYTASTGVYASNCIDKHLIESYVPFGMQDVDTDIEFTHCVDGTVIKRNNSTSKLRHTITKNKTGYYISNPLTLFQKQNHLIDLSRLREFLSDYLDVSYSIVPDYINKRLHFFVFGADKLDINEINKHIYSNFIDIEDNIKNCLDSIHYIQLEDNQPKPNQNLLLSLASK